MPTPNPSVESVLATRESLDQAMASAGGTKLSVQDLRGMSAVDLIRRLAPNGIRFHHEGQQWLTGNWREGCVPLYDKACRADFSSFPDLRTAQEQAASRLHRPKTETITIKVEVDDSAVQEYLKRKGTTVFNSLIQGSPPSKEVFAIDRLERDTKTGEVTYIREQLASFPSWTPKWYIDGRAAKGTRQERDRRRIVSSLMDEVGVALSKQGVPGAPFQLYKTKNTNDNVGFTAEQALLRKLAQYLGLRW